MKTVLLKGGLGNQLYQIAAIYAYSKDINDEFFIDYNAKFGAGQGKHPSTYKDTLYRNFITGSINPNFVVQQQSQFTYNPIPLFTGDVLFDGYFQSPKYFQKYKSELNDWFSYKEDEHIKFTSKLDQLREQTGKKIVGVHVRRGDYLNYPEIHPKITKSYYDKAKELFKDHIFLYATDDLRSVRNEFTFDNDNIYINGNSEMNDFITLSYCDSIIMGNSTFAAWASYLGKKKEKVIAPNPWFGPEGPDFKDLYDESWTILDT